MWLYDCGNLRFIQVNKAAIDHYGYTEADFLTMFITDIRAEEDAPEMNNLLNKKK